MVFLLEALLIFHKHAIDRLVGRLVGQDLLANQQYFTMLLAKYSYLNMAV